MFSLVLAVGVVGNVLVLIVILTSKSMRSSTNLFLLNLSIADLLVLIVCCPNAMIEMYMRTVSNTQPNTLHLGRMDVLRIILFFIQSKNLLTQEQKLNF